MYGCLVLTHPSGRTQLAAAKLFICFCVDRGWEEEDSLEFLHYLLDLGMDFLVGNMVFV